MASITSIHLATKVAYGGSYCSEATLAFPWTEVSKATQKANGGPGSA